MDAQQAAKDLERVEAARPQAWQGYLGSGPWFLVSSALLIAWGLVQDLAPSWGGPALFGFAGLALLLSVLPVTRRALFRTAPPHSALLGTSGTGTRTARTLRRTGWLVAVVAATVAFGVVARPSPAVGSSEATVSSTVLALGVVAACWLLGLGSRWHVRRGRQPR